MFQLKKAKVIDNAIISFSISTSDQAELSYAVFGGINLDQVVGGANGIIYNKVQNNHLNTWALDGQGLFYNGQNIKSDQEYPAVIDTGSSQLALPPALFEKLRKQWTKAIPTLNCKDHAVFCFAEMGCDKVMEKL